VADLVEASSASRESHVETKKIFAGALCASRDVTESWTLLMDVGDRARRMIIDAH